MTTPRRTGSLALGLALLCGGQAPAGAVPATRHVVLVAIDGVRNSEGLEPPEGATTRLPRLKALAEAEGTVFREMRTPRRALTSSNYAMLTTGAWFKGGNHMFGEEAGSDYYIANRPQSPTVFEELRRQGILADPEILVVSDKWNANLCRESIHPAFRGLGPTRVFQYAQNLNGTEQPPDWTYVDPAVNGDRDVYTKALEELGRTDVETRLAMLVLGINDSGGHSGRWDLYEDTLANADVLAADLWAWLQQDPRYRGTTTMIVTTDHGRHDDAHGGFRSHGGICRGCQDQLCFVLGPDTPRGQVVTRPCYSVDIAPTIARLLGGRMPRALGQPLYEAMGLTAQETAWTRQTDLSASVSGAGEDLSVAFIQLQDRAWSVRYRRSQGGQPMGAPVVLAQGSADTVAAEASVISNARGLQAAWLDYAGINPSGEGPWAIQHAVSADGGVSFSAPRRIFKELTGGPAEADLVRLNSPFLADRGDGEDLYATAYVPSVGNLLVRWESADAFQTKARRKVDYQIYRFAGFHQGGSATQDGWIAFSSIRAISGEDQMANWEVRVRHRDWPSGSRTVPNPAVTVSPTDLLHEAPCIMPAIASNAGVLSVAFAMKDPAQAGYPDVPLQVFLTQSPPPGGGELGKDWSGPRRISDSAQGCWQPSLLPLADGRLRIAYVDYATGDGDVCTVDLEATGVPGAPVNRTPGPEPSERPKLLRTASGKVYLAWEEGPAGISLQRLE